jgi:predicted Zn-dependent protease
LSAALSTPFALSVYAGSNSKKESADEKTTVTEDIYKALFSKKRTSAAEQKRARSNTAIMGIRGLDDDSDAAIKASATANMRAVYEMEDRVPSEQLVAKLKMQLNKQIPEGTAVNLPQALDTAQPTPAEFEGELELGRKMAAQVLGANRTYDNPKVVEYITALTKVVADSGLSSYRPFRVAILNSEKVNAFACPGGYIFVTKGALKSTRNEAQLAALLGHEVVHVSRRHLISSLQKKIGNTSDKKKLQDTSPHMAARQRVKSDASEEANQWAQVLGPKGVGLTLLQASSEALDTLLSKGLEQEFELEADALGQRVSSAAGYESRSLASLLSQIKATQTNPKNTISSTHPPYDLRIENISRYVASMVGQNAAVANGSELFAKMQILWSR